MPKPWAPDDKVPEWYCPDCRMKIPKPGHKTDCAMPLENPTRQEIDDSVYATWNKNASYAYTNYSRNIERTAELLQISRDAATIVHFIDMTSLNTQNDLKGLRSLFESVLGSDIVRKQAEVIKATYRELEERRKAEDWKHGEDGEGE